MTVGHQDFFHAGFVYPTHGGIHIARHQTAKAWIFRMAWVNLVPVSYTGDAFHIGSNEYFHVVLLLYFRKW